jgi:hypothetical protein
MVRDEAVSVDPTARQVRLAGGSTLSYDRLIVSPGVELSIVLLYASTRFERASVERMLDHFQTLLEAIAADPERRVSDFPLSTAAERRQLLVDWNQTDMAYSRDSCVHQLFETWVLETPQAPAVSCQRERLSYADVNQRANRVAHSLRRRDVTAGSPVAICMERSSSMVAAMLDWEGAALGPPELDVTWWVMFDEFLCETQGKSAEFRLAEIIGIRHPKNVLAIQVLEAFHHAKRPSLSQLQPNVKLLGIVWKTITRDASISIMPKHHGSMNVRIIT